VSQGLGGVRHLGREKKQERFRALLHHLTVELPRRSYYALKRNASPGVDGLRWGEYENGLEDRLKDLHGRVHRGSYRSQPSRRVYIPKADGRQRPSGIAALEDKIVQQAVVTILNEIHGGQRCAVAVRSGRRGGTDCDRPLKDGFPGPEFCIHIPTRVLTLNIRGRSRMR
jgi:hypothetical protein